jgi:hypothetical protein
MDQASLGPGGRQPFLLLRNLRHRNNSEIMELTGEKKRLFAERARWSAKAPKVAPLFAL